MENHKEHSDHRSGHRTEHKELDHSVEGAFQGFSPDTLAFLNALGANNERHWFEAHKEHYENLVREPALAFIRAMAPLLAEISPHFPALDRKVGGSLMRVNRDVRFSAEKSPYKTNIGIHFRHALGKDVHAPGFYFHADPAEIFVGVGIYHPDSATTTLLRRAISAHWPEYSRILEAIRQDREAGLEPYGEVLSRPPRGFEAEDPALEELKRKDFVLTTSLDESAFSAADLPQRVARIYRTAAPYQAFLCRALGLEF